MVESMTTIMYLLTQSKGTTKLLLQFDRKDYGTMDAPTFTLNGLLQASICILIL